MNFNPRSPHGERPGYAHRFGTSMGISIHAPRMGSDIVKATKLINIKVFQSTLPAWGATSRAFFKKSNIR